MWPHYRLKDGTFVLDGSGSSFESQSMKRKARRIVQNVRSKLKGKKITRVKTNG